MDLRLLSGLEILAGADPVLLRNIVDQSYEYDGVAKEGGASARHS